MCDHIDVNGVPTAAVQPPKTIVEAIYARVLDAPAAPFCWFREDGTFRAVTNAQFLESSEGYAQTFESLELSSGDVVIIIGRQAPWLTYAFTGAMFIGAIPAILPHPSAKQDPHYFWRDCKTLLDRIQAKAVVVGDEFLPDMQSQLRGATFQLVSPRTVRFSAAQWRPRVQEPKDIAFLQHSSGTTGLKKGVMLSHESVLAQVRSYSAAIGFRHDDIVASWLPLYHDMGLLAAFMAPLLNRAAMVWLDPFEWVGKPHLLLEAIERFSATFIWLPNFAFQHLAATAPKSRSWRLDSVRAFISCSEPTKAKSLDAFAHRFIHDGVSPDKIQVCYALAENVFAATQTPLNGVPRRLALDDSRRSVETSLRTETTANKIVISCGSPIDGVDISIVDEDDNPVANGVIGEIRLRSTFMFSGYNRQPDLTAAKLKDGWYYTGDLGLLDKGEVFVTGRKDDLLIVYGRNYYAHDIEEIVSEFDGIIPGRVVAFGLEDVQLGTQRGVVVAEVRTEAATANLAKEVRVGVERRLGLSIADVLLVKRGWLAKTTSGKISRHQNREKFLKTRLET
jgi:fatty-acyl-CoA synthase